MARIRTLYRCSSCGAAAAQWAGRCSSCAAWNTLEEQVEAPSAALGPTLAGVATGQPPIPIVELAAERLPMLGTGVAELDRVLGGGLVPGSVALVAGEPGVGKSTLLLQAAAAIAAAGHSVLYVSAEESVQQVRLRAERLGALQPRLWLVAAGSLAPVAGYLDQVAPEVVIVDSVQAVHDPALGSAPGTVGQVRGCAQWLVQEAKRRSCAALLVGHVTKDGGLAGPRTLEHVVDTVLAFEGDRHHALRLLRVVKHRFGSTSELGLFEMTGAGVEGVPDASALFLADRCRDVAGSVVVPTLDGHRPLLVELQALVSPDAAPGNARRSAQGVDGGRLNLLLAVLGRIPTVGTLAGNDVFASVAGGVKVVEPAADLGLALAVMSSLRGVPLGHDLVALGEVGLSGELRQVSQTSRRLAEAARLGFRRALLPASSPAPPAGMRALRVRSLAAALDAVLPERPPLRGDRPARSHRAA